MLNLDLTQEAFGLDISDLSLKIAKLKKQGERLKLASFAKTKIAKGIIEKGKIKNEKKLVEVIKKGIAEVKGEPIKTKYVVASLPEEKAFLDVIQMPPLPEEELGPAVRYQAENYIPLSIKDAYLDFKPVQAYHNHPKILEVLIGAVPKTIVDSYTRTLKLAGLQPKILEIESMAIVRALIKKETAARPLLIIDFGQTRTSFIIFSGYSLRFTSTIPISSQGLSEIVAANLNISFARAEELKLKYGLSGEKHCRRFRRRKGEQCKVFEAMIPALTDLAEQIKILLDYYHSHAPRQTILHDGKEMSKILLCGEGSLLKGLVEFLNSHLKMPVELGDPRVNIASSKSGSVKLPFKESLGYATALGLALRGVYGY